MNNTIKLGITAAPAELINKFNTISEAAAAYAVWQKENLPVGRPKQNDVPAVQLGTLRQMVKK
jgi:hypothetical protein